LVNADFNLSLSTLKDLISDERIFVEFQSILSARNHLIVGIEGLIRGKTQEGRMIPPMILFDAARDYGMTLELDRLCREKVLAGFSSVHCFQHNYLLFLNLETSFISSKVVGSGYLLDQVARHNIPPANVVIEIVESKTEDDKSLLQFVNAYRACGFNIALDDVGTGHSNFERISRLRPNIIKVDRSIISGMATNYFKQEIFKSLSNLSKNIGCLTLSEGVETQEEVLCSIEYGADLLQGYYFSRPKHINREESDEEEQKLEDLLITFRMKQIDFVKTRRMQNQQYHKTVRRIIRRIQGKSLEEANALLRTFINESDTIDALYIINNEGIQITDTVMKIDDRQLINPVFRATNKNENLAHKDYVYQLINTDLKHYTTDRYISFATGKLCVTLSRSFKGEQNHPCILCTDFMVRDADN
jgi:EAL domain-containing protein (putative c-di-GMP-specific phosphodiesterase class I)